MSVTHKNVRLNLISFLTSSISVRMLGEAVDDGVDRFLEDGLGPRIGHRTRHRPAARGNRGRGLRLRPRHVRRHPYAADTTTILLRPSGGIETLVTILYRPYLSRASTTFKYPVTGTHVNTNANNALFSDPLCFSGEREKPRERAG